MNIFFLDYDPKNCAIQHCDQHVQKMILETAQMLSTAHHVLDPDTEKHPLIYKKTHSNHPCNVWIRKSSENYDWALELLVNLLGEYNYRTGKVHKTENMIDAILYPPENINHVGFTSPPNCTTTQKDEPNIVRAYQKYYQDKYLEWSTRTDKRQIIMKWTNRDIPKFMESVVEQHPNEGSRK